MDNFELTKSFAMDFMNKKLEEMRVCRTIYRTMFYFLLESAWRTVIGRKIFPPRTSAIKNWDYWIISFSGSRSQVRTKLRVFRQCNSAEKHATKPFLDSKTLCNRESIHVSWHMILSFLWIELALVRWASNSRMRKEDIHFVVRVVMWFPETIFSLLLPPSPFSFLSSPLPWGRLDHRFSSFMACLLPPIMLCC